MYILHNYYGCISSHTAYNKYSMDTPVAPCIRLTNITKCFGIGDAEHYALDDVNLTVEKGEFIAIMGPSGCGKTTLLNIIGLLDQATDGEYFLNGDSVDNLGSKRLARIRSDDIGFVFQNFNLIPRLSVLENVSLPLTYKGMSKIKRLQEASRILKNFHLGEREYYMPHQLSGGQVQRVAIARALVNSPSIILADEPTGNLDIHRRGNTIIMVTHNPELTSYASRVITMLDGRIDTDEQLQKSAPFRKNLEIVDEKKEAKPSDKPKKSEKKTTETTEKSKKEDSKPTEQPEKEESKPVEKPKKEDDKPAEKSEKKSSTKSTKKTQASKKETAK